MGRNQNETGEGRGARDEERGAFDTYALLARSESALFSSTRPSSLVPRAFTLTELLVVITIIAILASLITGAAVNAMRRSKQASITLEITQLANSLEDFKNTYGAYPPNGMVQESPAPIVSQNGTNILSTTQQDFELMFKKAFPRHQEPAGLIARLAGSTAAQNSLAGRPSLLQGGLLADESLVFWLGGFSDDPAYPISGPGGPSFSDTRPPTGAPGLEDEVLEDRNRRYEFDLGRLGPRTPDGAFDAAPTGKGRWLTYEVSLNGGPIQVRRINLWTYNPTSSKLPLVYFDTSRHDPVEYDVALLGTLPANTPRLYGLKTLREGIASPTDLRDLVFVNKGKFQILHAGIDDIWGEGLWATGLLNQAGSNYKNLSDVFLMFPTGPFLGDVADTVGNFGTGTLADAQE